MLEYIRQVPTEMESGYATAERALERGDVEIKSVEMETRDFFERCEPIGFLPPYEPKENSRNNDTFAWSAAKHLEKNPTAWKLEVSV